MDHTAWVYRQACWLRDSLTQQVNCLAVFTCTQHITDSASIHSNKTYTNGKKVKRFTCGEVWQ